MIARYIAGLFAAAMVLGAARPTAAQVYYERSVSVGPGLAFYYGDVALDEGEAAVGLSLGVTAGEKWRYFAGFGNFGVAYRYGLLGELLLGSGGTFIEGTLNLAGAVLGAGIGWHSGVLLPTPGTLGLAYSPGGPSGHVVCGWDIPAWNFSGSYESIGEAGEYLAVFLEGRFGLWIEVLDGSIQSFMDYSVGVRVYFDVRDPRGYPLPR